MWRMAVVLAAAAGLVLPACKGKAPQKRILGHWEVVGADGKSTGQVVKITEKKISMTHPARGEVVGDAIFKKKGEQIVAKWQGAESVFVLSGKEKLSMVYGGTKLSLKRKR